MRRKQQSIRRVVAGMAVMAATVVSAIACGSPPKAPISAPGSSQQPAPPPPADVSSAGDIPDNQAFVAYSPADHAFTLKVPEGWAKTDVTDGVVFTDKLNTITVTSRPTVVQPTVDSVNTLELPDIAKSGKNFQPGTVTKVDRPTGPAILLTYGEDSPPNPVTGKVVPLSVERYEFYRTGHQLTIMLAAPVGADNVDPWRTVTDSFAWTP